MSELVMPYFFTNEEWFYYEYNLEEHFLTDKGKAIKEVVESYNQYQKDSKELDKIVMGE